MSNRATASIDLEFACPRESGASLYSIAAYGIQCIQYSVWKYINARREWDVFE